METMKCVYVFGDTHLTVVLAVVFGQVVGAARTAVQITDPGLSSIITLSM